MGVFIKLEGANEVGNRSTSKPGIACEKCCSPFLMRASKIASFLMIADQEVLSKSNGLSGVHSLSMALFLPLIHCRSRGKILDSHSHLRMALMMLALVVFCFLASSAACSSTLISCSSSAWALIWNSSSYASSRLCLALAKADALDSDVSFGS